MPTHVHAWIRCLPLLLAVISCLAPSARADVFPLQPGDDLVGDVQTAIARDEDTLLDIARGNELGFEEIRAANPGVDAWLPKGGTVVVLPRRHLLPPTPREGIVINTAEMRLYYFPRKKSGKPATVETFPVSVGDMDWATPLVTTRVIRKTVDPVWHPPKSLRAEHAAEGDILPEAIQAGPDNPLGKYALYMTIPSYLIHGTNKEYGIGMQVTHGCIRMYPEDIERLYREVPIGTPVRIINQPYKTGWHQGQLYLEVHPLLEGAKAEQYSGHLSLAGVMIDAVRDHPGYPVNWLAARQAARATTGMPVPVGPGPEPTPPEPQ